MRHKKLVKFYGLNSQSECYLFIDIYLWRKMLFNANAYETIRSEKTKKTENIKSVYFPA